MEKLLIIQTASIGDVILVTPLLESIHGSFQDAEIDVLIKKGNEGLFTDHPYLNQLLVWDKKNSKYKNLFRLIKLIRRRKYDVVINVQRFFSTGLVTVLSGADKKIGFDKNPFAFGYSYREKHLISDPDHVRHEVDRNLGLLKPLAIEGRRKPVLYPPKKDFDFVEHYKTSQYICIAPASLWFTKQYPADKWIEFIVALPDQAKVYLLGSGADEKLCRDIAEACADSDIVNLAGKLSLLQTAALMQDSWMNYVNDSAPQHLASAVNAAVSAIFCSTVPSFGFGPLSENAKVIETASTLDCRPCGLHGKRACPEQHFRCAYDISKEQLLNRLL